MNSLRDDPRPSSSKLTLLTSIRRLTPKLKREHTLDELGRSAADSSQQLASTSSRSKYARMTHESQTTSSFPSVYCPPLASPTPSPKRRVRTSGSRLPSGYRPKPSPMRTISLDTGIRMMSEPHPESDGTPDVTSQPIRTRLTRFLRRHSTPLCPSDNTTPVSSTLSFPSSSSRTTTTPSSLSSSPTVSQKRVRFSPSITTPKDDRKRSGTVEKERVADALLRMGSPWRRNQEGREDL